MPTTVAKDWTHVPSEPGLPHFLLLPQGMSCVVFVLFFKNKVSFIKNFKSVFKINDTTNVIQFYDSKIITVNMFVNFISEIKK